MHVDEQLRTRIERAARKGNAHFELETFLYNLETDHAFILDIEGTLVGCEVRVETNNRYLLVMFMEGTGVLNQLSKFVSLTANLARQLGCSYVETYGRLGWSRAFKDHGIKTRYVAYKMEVL